MLRLADWLDAVGDAEGRGWRRLVESGKRPHKSMLYWWLTSTDARMGTFGKSCLPMQILNAIPRTVRNNNYEGLRRFPTQLSALIAAARAWSDAE